MLSPDPYTTSPVEFINSFDSFYRHRLHHLPILDIQKPVDAVLRESPLLFWAVVVVSARDHPEHSTYFSSLLVPFKGLLSEYLVSPFRSERTIQALLLLCTWPFPVNMQADDPSWNYCGMAVAAALQRGLKPSLGTAFQDPAADDASLKIKTWLGCFVVSTT